MTRKYQAVIIGAGPGGYAAAIRAAQRGLSVCLIEKDKLGGVCLNRGCIPTKALIKSAYTWQMLREAESLGIFAPGARFDFKRCMENKEAVVNELRAGVESLLKKRGVEIIRGTGRLSDERIIDVDGVRVEFEHCIAATGSAPVEIPAVPLDAQKGILSSDGMLELKEIPPRLVIIGGGAIGCEFAFIFNRLGSEVTILEKEPQLLPQEDADVGRCLAVSFKKSGINVFTKSRVTGAQYSGAAETQINFASAAASGSGGEDRAEKSCLSAEKIMVAAGRKPQLQECGILSVGARAERGKIIVNEYMQTSLRRVYAVGDAVGRTYLAHTAAREGITAAEHIAGNKIPMSYDCIPRCVYAKPETAAVGITEKQARETGRQVRVGKFPLTASGKAKIEKETDGFFKIITDAGTNEIIGAALCGSQAAELIAEIAVAMSARMSADELAKVVHAHPTMAEAVMESAQAVSNTAIHLA